MNKGKKEANRCVEFGGDNAFVCEGKNGRSSCIYFDISGQDLTSSLEYERDAVNFLKKRSIKT